MTDKSKDPITLEVFTDPVIASDGHTYEWSALKTWMETNKKKTSPLTMEVLRPWVYVNKAMCEKFGILEKEPFCRRLYSSLDCPMVSIPIDGTLAHIPWIVCLLTEMGWRRQKMTLQVPAIRGSQPKWTVLGPPIAFSFRKKLEDWVHDFGLDTFFINPSCLSTSVFYVNDHPVCRLEVICGLENLE